MTALPLPAELARARSVLVLAPHPDDEILGCGYLMQAFTEAGTPLEVVWLTDGGAAHGEAAGAAREALVAQREREALAGLRAMAIDCETAFLHRPDGALSAARHRYGAAAELRAIVDRRAVDTIFVTDGDDNHPDHRAAFAIARRMPVPALYSYPVSARYDGESQGERAALTAEVGDAAVKRRALACHASQRADAGALYPMTDAAIERFCIEPERFHRIKGGQP